MHHKEVTFVYFMVEGLSNVYYLPKQSTESKQLGLGDKWNPF